MKTSIALGLGLFLAVACGSPQPRPDAGAAGGGAGGATGGGGGSGGGNASSLCRQTCVGCCDATGACITGISATRCGTAGAACVSCGTGQSCDATGFCKLPNCGACAASNGTCTTSLSNQACGNQGYACVDCAAVGATCDTNSGQCTGGVCGGCRNAFGVCQPGAERSACGTGGFACAVCGAGELCVNGACASADAGMGGGSGGAGGSGGSAGTSCAGDLSTELPLPTGTIGAVRLIPLSGGWAMAWQRDGLIEFGRLDASGALVAASIKTVANLGGQTLNSLNVASSGAGYAVVYSAGSSQNSRQGQLVRLDATGTVVGSPTALPNPTGKQDAIAVAWNPQDAQWGVVWREGVLTAATKFARYDAMGAAVGAPVSPMAGLLSAFPIAWTGQNFVVVTTYAGQSQLMTITPQGTISGTTQIVGMAVFPNQVALVGSGTELGVTFMDDSRGGTWNNPHIRFARFTTAGAAVGADFPISGPPPTVLSLPSPGNVAWNGTSFAATWAEKVGGVLRVFRALINASGVIAGSTVQVSCSTSEDDFSATIQPSGAKHAVVFLRGARARIQVF